MKHLIFVSVALGIFSGTSISVQAQTSDNSVRQNDVVTSKRSVKFIEGIEIRPGAMDPDQSHIKRSAEVSPKITPKNPGAGIESCSSMQFKYAQLLDIDVESITNRSLYSFVDKWWAVPYQYGGATQKGIDCSAYSCTLLHDVYGVTTSRTAKDQYDACEKIEKENLQEGDLVFFKTRRGVSHVGVYLGNGYFTHSSVGSGVTISNLQEPYYNKKYIGGGRIAMTAAE